MFNTPQRQKLGAAWTIKSAGNLHPKDDARLWHYITRQAHREQAVELLLRLRKALLVHGIHQENNGIHLRAAAPMTS